MQANVAKLQGIEGQLLELAKRHPRTGAAERALLVLVNYHVFGSDSTTAWEILARDHARSDRIKQVLDWKLELYWASQGVEDLLHNASEQNPYREIRGLACYWLAQVLQTRAQYLRLWPFQPPDLNQLYRQRFGPQDLDRVLKQDPKALEHRAARLYDRVIAEFPFVANNDRRTERPPMILGQLAGDLPAVARVHLDELQRLSVGKPAPEIEGVDLDGKPMKLSDFRGKVVVLSVPRFDIQGSPIRPSKRPHNASPSSVASLPLIEGKPVALLGVVASDRDGHRKAVQQSGLPIRFWWDPDREGQPEHGRVGAPGPDRSTPLGTPRNPTST